ncbi:isoprenylcysteine carboxylmethyltransferase family protein [Rhizobium sp. T1470]|uniref:methyltransferase family protein n=1 Tax=unclassified Rhizobium TaxID=2613769 RepID=UPI001AAE3412|nr:MULTISPECIES: isoprenylcysteine carboxylmethyltransferase family protein [unclassified Rhizobium]MCA0802768.1 isoprenylcysteine carboxylmethyltransferase family protein [Rhizobium sp. T1473]UFS84712.1 isoprenylcysteine carboxylmethyltransferase family protein [Rhizobium sp. T136]
MKNLMLTIGTFFFKYRNQAFPLIIVALFIAAPPTTTVLGSAALKQWADIVALLIVLAGLLLRATVIGYAYIKRGGLNKRVYAKDLVTEGMFGVCRNPLYVGNMLVYSGLFLFHGDPVVVIVGCLLFGFIYQCIIYAEEEFLADKFGDAYSAYCRDVPRWGLKLSAFSASTEGMAFNAKRVIAKDYSTMSSTLIALLATEFYRIAADSISDQELSYAILLLALFVVVIALTGLVSSLKKLGVFDKMTAAH